MKSGGQVREERASAIWSEFRRLRIYLRPMTHSHMQLAISPTRAILAAVVITHGAAAGLILLVAPLWQALIAMLIIGASGLLAARRCSNRQSAHEPHLADMELGLLQVRADGGDKPAEAVSQSTFVSPLATLIALRVGSRRKLRYVLLTRDNIHPDAFRRMRVALRWGTAHKIS